jgi:oligopeptide/dipeptide ABC transporter ATP-binding protein
MSTATSTSGEATLALSVRGLCVSYDASRRHPGTRVLDDVELDIPKGTVLGLVGESGSGKSTFARTITGLVPRQEGHVQIAGSHVPASGRFPRELRRHVQMVFQDPYSSLDPTWPVVRSIAEPLSLQAGSGSSKNRRQRALDALALVGIDPSTADRKPNAFSGGQRQRIAIARAIAVEPELLICDEPVSALDVSTQNQILALLRDLQSRIGVSILFISHDLAVVRQIATNVAVMYLGKVVESGTVEQVLRRPQHPYARVLRDAVPRIGHRATVQVRRDRNIEVGDPGHRGGGCVFVERCPIAIDHCRTVAPELDVHGDHAVACHLADDEEIHRTKEHDDVARA